MTREGLSWWLRGLDDARLVELVGVRLGRTARVPASFDQLASLLSSPQSCDEAVRRLDRTAVQVVAVLAESGGRGTVDGLADALASPPVRVGEALQRAQALALAWPVTDGSWRTAAGLGPLAARLLRRGLPWSSLLEELPHAALVSLLRAHGLTGARSSWQAVQVLAAALPDRVGPLLAEAPAAAEALRGLVSGDAPCDDEVASWLVARGLVLQLGDAWFVPAEVEVAVRGGRVVLRVEVPPEQRAGRAARPDTAAVTALLSRSQALLAAAAAEPPKALVSGGLGVKELRRLAKAVGEALETTVLLLQVLAGAGLMATGLRAGTVTAAGRRWWQLPEELAYVRLVGPQLHPRAVLEPAGASPSGVLLGVARSGYDLPIVRDVALAAARRGAETDASLVAHLDWSRWRPGSEPSRLAGYAQPLEVLALLALRSAGTSTPAPWLAPLLADEPEGPGLLVDSLEEDRAGALEAARLLAGHLPPAQRDVVLQADGTAVVGGRPDPGLRALLDRLGARESDHTWRLAPARVRAALDAGRSAPELLADLHDRARHGVPAVLERMVQDVARAHGRIRLHGATTVLHLDDPVLAVELRHDRRLRALALEEVAPGVLTTAASPQQVAAALRAAGHAPVGDGATPDPDPSEPGPARPTHRPTVPQRAWGHDPAEVVAALRAGADRAGAGPAPEPPARPASEPARVTDASTRLLALLGHLEPGERALLVRAVRSGGRVQLDYVDAAGAPTTRVVSELEDTGYLLEGWCELRSAERTFDPRGVLSVRPAP